MQHVRYPQQSPSLWIRSCCLIHAFKYAVAEAELQCIKKKRFACFKYRSFYCVHIASCEPFRMRICAIPKCLFDRITEFWISLFVHTRLPKNYCWIVFHPTPLLGEVSPEKFCYLCMLVPSWYQLVPKLLPTSDAWVPTLVSMLVPVG